MVCACYLLFQVTYFLIILGYPLKCLYELNKQGKTDEKWIYYFFFLIVVYIGEVTILFPFKYLLGKIDFCKVPTVKANFALWLYYPTQRNGIKIIESLIGKHLELAFIKIKAIIGKYAEKIGIPNRDEAAVEKKTE